jgi:two-component system cell cycle sensor histidine kinase PleC
LCLLRLLTDGSPAAHVMAPMVPVYMIFLFLMSRVANRRVDAMIAARFVNEDLAAALTRARDEAVKKRYEAETASASKTAFLANMSHELRTPLNAVLGFSDIIARQSMGRDQMDRYSDYASDIHSSGAHLLSLINDLLDVAKIESGKMEIDPRPIDPRAVVENIARLVAPRVADKGQTLSVKIAADTPLVLADERALKQMLLNLLGNAIKFTPNGGCIAIACWGPAEGGLEICVSDNGPGISPEKMEHVFEPFSQLDNRFDREAGGTGLGLALVQGLVRLHGGRVWLESAPGAGVKARLYFPSTVAAKGAPRRAEFRAALP